MQNIYFQLRRSWTNCWIALGLLFMGLSPAHAQTNPSVEVEPYTLTSQPESFGRTTLEALSLGVPVAGYDHGGVGEQLNLLFPLGKIPPGDTAAAAKTIRQLLESRPAVPASHPFTLQRMLDQTVEVYQELLGSPRL